MRAFTLRLDGTRECARQALGAVVCARVGFHSGKKLLDKGHIVAEEDLPALSLLSDITLSLIAPEEGDLHEIEAARRLAEAAAGPGVSARPAAEARYRLVSIRRGLLQVDAHTLGLMNGIGPVSIYTLFDGQPVEAAEVVAEAKVTPLVVPASQIEQAEAVAASSAPVKVLPFKAMRVGVLIRERMAPAQARKMAESLSAKLHWFGSVLTLVRYASLEDSPHSLAHQMRDVLNEGMDLLLVSGGSSSDPADPLMSAMAHLPARVERVGIPVHPGSMLWLARCGRVPILGVPSCGMFSQSSAFDLVLPLLLAGQPVTSATFAALGYGGLLAKGDRRFPQYEE